MIVYGAQDYTSSCFDWQAAKRHPGRAAGTMARWTGKGGISLVFY